MVAEVYWAGAGVRSGWRSSPDEGTGLRLLGVPRGALHGCGVAFNAGILVLRTSVAVVHTLHIVMDAQNNLQEGLVYIVV